jgi:hypothetical protein
MNMAVLGIGGLVYMLRVLDLLSVWNTLILMVVLGTIMFVKLLLDLDLSIV